MTYTDEQGNGIPEPEREEFTSLAEFWAAHDAWKTRITNIANRAFDDQLRKSLRATCQPSE